MYESHWGLNARPFDRRADGAFYYPAEGHQAALVKLRYALEHSCGAALAGASGVGKTLLLDSLVRQLADRGYVFVKLAYPRLSPGGGFAATRPAAGRWSTTCSAAWSPIGWRQSAAR